MASAAPASPPFLIPGHELVYIIVIQFSLKTKLISLVTY